MPSTKYATSAKKSTSKKTTSASSSSTKSKSKTTKKSTKKKNDAVDNDGETRKTTTKKKTTNTNALAHTMSTQIAKVLNKGQKTMASHKKCVAMLLKIQNRDPQCFFNEFVKLIKRILVINKKDPAVDRIVQLIASFTKTVENYPMLKKRSTSGNNNNNNSAKDKATDDDDEDMDDVEELNAGGAASGEDGGDASSDNFGSFLIHELLKYADCTDKAIRFRVCQIIGKIIHSMGDDAEISGELWDSMLKALVPRLRDKVTEVRLHAVYALMRFQDPTDPENDVLREYLNLLSTDSNKAVRKVVLEVLGIDKDNTVPEILKRVRDKEEDVRKHAFTVISEKINMERQLTVDQRVAVLKYGLSDSSESVRIRCVDMLCNKWLIAHLQSDVLKLLQLLDVEQNTKVGEDVLKIIFDQQSISSNIDLQLGRLTPESTLFWRIKCEHLVKTGYEYQLDDILPAASVFRTVIEKYHEEQEFVCKQLLLLARLLDYHDEVGRERMYSLLVEMLVTFKQPEMFVEEIMTCLLRVSPTIVDYRDVVIRAIEELRDDAVSSVETTDSQTTLEEEGRAENMWMRSLIILSHLLQTPQVRLSESLDKMNELFETVIVQALQHENLSIRNTAIKVLGQFCIKNKEKAVECFSTLLSTVDEVSFLNGEGDSDDDDDDDDRELQWSIQTTCLKAIFDILMVHGLSVIPQQPQPQPDDEDDEETRRQQQTARNEETVLKKLKVFISLNPQRGGSKLTALQRELRRISTEGFAKLFVCKRLVNNPDILSDLLLLRFDPYSSERGEQNDDDEVQQCLSIFFPAFAFSTGSALENMKQIEQAFLAAVRKSFHHVIETMPSLGSIKQFKEMVQFVSYLCNVDNIEEKRRKQIEHQLGIHNNSATIEECLTLNHHAAQGRLATMLALEYLVAYPKSSKEREQLSKAVCPCMGSFIVPTKPTDPAAPAPPTLPDTAALSEDDEEGEDERPKRKKSQQAKNKRKRQTDDDDDDSEEQASSTSKEVDPRIRKLYLAWRSMIKRLDMLVQDMYEGTDNKTSKKSLERLSKIIQEAKKGDNFTANDGDEDEEEQEQEEAAANEGEDDSARRGGLRSVVENMKDHHRREREASLKAMGLEQEPTKRGRKKKATSNKKTASKCSATTTSTSASKSRKSTKAATATETATSSKGKKTRKASTSTSRRRHKDEEEEYDFDDDEDDEEEDEAEELKEIASGTEEEETDYDYEEEEEEDSEYEELIKETAASKKKPPTTATTKDNTASTSTTVTTKKPTTTSSRSSRSSLSKKLDSDYEDEEDEEVEQFDIDEDEDEDEDKVMQEATTTKAPPATATKGTSNKPSKSVTIETPQRQQQRQPATERAARSTAKTPSSVKKRKEQEINKLLDSDEDGDDNDDSDFEEDLTAPPPSARRSSAKKITTTPGGAASVTQSTRKRAAFKKVLQEIEDMLSDEDDGDVDEGGDDDEDSDFL